MIRRRRHRSVLLIILLVSAATGSTADRLVIEAARDTTQGFVSRDLAGPGRRLLAWPEGVLSVPDTAAWLPDGETGLAFALVSDRAAAAGPAGRLGLRPGRYGIDTPLLLTDGVLSAHLTSGTLEVSEAGEVRYRRPGGGIGSRGTLLLLAGLGLATVVLLRAVRRRATRP
jgi:hypothetical protein